MMPSAPTSFGSILRQYRERIHLTQVELADLSAVSIRAIRNLELGRSTNPRRETVRLLADALRLSGERRAALHLAAGHDADRSTFDQALSHVPSMGGSAVERERETEAVVALVGRGTQRVIRVTGFAGVGKTRLARAVSEEVLRKLRMPSLWVPLNGTASRDASLLPWAEGLAAGGRRAADELASLLGQRSVLLVLDGNDTGQVPDEAIDVLTGRCPNVNVLVTSRCPGEQSEDYHLPLRPLTVTSSPGEPSPAVNLLVRSILRIDPTFRVTEPVLADLASLAGRLDGLPRALESAASWFLLSTAHELARTADLEPLSLTVPPTHSTGDWVRDACTMAVSSLSPESRLLLDLVTADPQAGSLEELALRSGMGRLEAARAMHSLVLRGLIQPSPSTEEPGLRFSALHLVRHTLTAPQPSMR
ncbi:helix-turn-helix domain-containing protein [Streptomyces sp. NPDC051001]|uniref:helix-turn-helix domain-containing protein n=1 Tax=Streptomyces sp. NPDC051001 TaxID=3155795 RepID=UPI00341B13F7